MKTLVLILLNCLLLWSTITYGNAAADLPPLPTTEISNSTKSDESDKSLWNRILVWFGLGEKEPVKETAQAKPAMNEELTKPSATPDVPSLPTAPLPPQEQSQDSSSLSSNTNHVIEVTVNATPLVVTTPKSVAMLQKNDSNNSGSNVTDSQPKNITPIPSSPVQEPISPSEEIAGKPTDLKLPEGFDIDKDEDSNTKPAEDKIVEEKANTEIQHPIEQKKETPPAIAEAPKAPAPTETKNKTEIGEEIPNLPNLNSISDNTSSSSPTPLANQENTPPAQEVNFTPPPPPPSDTTPPATENEKEENKVESKENAPIIPDLSVAENEGSTDSTKAQIKNFRKNLQERLNQTETLPEIPLHQTASNKDKSGNAQNIVDDAAQLKFVMDEAQVLQLPNDDVVLGEVTSEARLELMDFSSYVPIFWANYNTLRDEPARLEIDNFIKTYDSNPIKPSHPEIESALEEAFRAIDTNLMYDLISLLETYPILQLTDQEGNNLLHRAAQSNNYYAAKFLLMKGINWGAQNHSGQTAKDIVLQNNDPQMIKLFQSAGIR